MSAAQILVPVKFTGLMLQLIATSVIYSSQYENLINFPNDIQAEQSLQAGVTLSLIFIIIEMIILGTGLTMHFEKVILTQIILHFLGVVILAWFILDSWNYDLIWMIFSFFWYRIYLLDFKSLIPLLMECSAIINALMFRRAIVRVKT